MRGRTLVLVTLVSAGLGGALVLLVTWMAGWRNGETRTVILTESAPIAVTSVASPSRRPARTFDPIRIYARRSRGVVTIYSVFGSGSDTRAAQGSGFVVSRDGVILTSSHVITTAGSRTATAAPARRVYVEFDDRDRVAAEIVGWDVFDDIAALRVDPGQHPLAPLPVGDSSKVVVGQPVAAIGSPFGNENSLTVGVVSATRRSIESLTSRYNLVDAIQVDAPINHGNSGGPLLDSEGRVIGVNAQIRSDSGTAEGVGFAVPINAAIRSMKQLLATGKVSYAYVGITTGDLTPGAARRFGYPVRYGALITSVRSGSPASRAGLRGGTVERRFNGATFTVGGDLLVAIDGHRIRSAEDVVRIVSERLRPRQTSTFTIMRDGSRRRVEVLLGERPQNPDA